jgi:hypothetical protein
MNLFSIIYLTKKIYFVKFLKVFSLYKARFVNKRAVLKALPVDYMIRIMNTKHVLITPRLVSYKILLKKTS